MARPTVRCGLDPSRPYEWFHQHRGDPNCEVCKQCLCYETCSSGPNQMDDQLNCSVHREDCGKIHTNTQWLQPDGTWQIAPEMISTESSGPDGGSD